ncbi:branched-chain amino acid transport system II carrier protein [Aquimarina brevivitae]|uniref:LIVCS family branched-chain amino acid:cation transporter n=1 Tax=Aquimarina brevivitae TaxID=323412 RepID=A0A4Q7PKR8_9FLAO|nr:branched-chain amino acid transport system II carrier protein [Aquimarina brevivitae]RZS99562.1 LIVCS family branched-chain amino acid:cation transporter [Aquimarina brevivitae]
MRLNKETFVAGFALFSMFFGAGNLMLPPFLGHEAGDQWNWVTFGFIISAVIIPILGIVAHAKIQGTMFDFGKKVSPVFSYIYCFAVYAISIGLPSPRTASVTHEIAIQPYLDSGYLLTSSIYFALVLLFVLNRSKILDIIGKFLTPVILLTILSIIGIGLFTGPASTVVTDLEKPFVRGLFEGYQTFDAIGAVVIGGVIIVSLKLKGASDFKVNKALIIKSGCIAGLALLLVYTGLIYNGSIYSTWMEPNSSRIEVLSSLSIFTLGHIGKMFLGLLVSLACFTTAIGIVTGTADFVKGFFGDSDKAFKATAIIGCLLGVLMGQFDVNYIINIAVPALMLIYPVTIGLIFLNLVPHKYASPPIFKGVVAIILLFSIPDFLNSVGLAGVNTPFLKYIPLSSYNLGWFLPAIVIFVLLNILLRKGNQ